MERTVRLTLSVLLATLVAWGPAMADNTPYYRLRPGDGAAAGGNTTTSNTGKATITGPSPLEGHVYSYLSQAYVASPPDTYTWTAVGLPEGLAIRQNGTVAGVPAKAGTYGAVILAVGRESGAALLPVTVHVRDVLRVINAQDRTAHTGEAFALPTPTVLGDAVPPLSWTSTTTLPSCLSLDPAAGTITGKCTATGNYNTSLKLVDATQADAVSNSFTVRIGDGIHIDPVPDQVGRVGMPFPATYPTFKGIYEPPLAWSYQGSDAKAPAPPLPDGLSVNASNGSIVGTPHAYAKASGYQIVGNDQSGFPSVSNTFGILVSLPLAFEAPADAWAHVGNDAFLAPPTLENDPISPTFWEMVGTTAPSGMTFSTSSGYLQGKPTVAGTTTTEVRATDNQGAVATSAPYSLHVLPPMGIGKVADVNVLTGEQVDIAPPAVTNAKPPLTWGLQRNAKLPNGMALDPATGRITGADLKGERQNVGYQVNDSAGGTVSSGWFGIAVATSMAVSPQPSTTVRVGDALAPVAPTVIGYPTDPVSWSLFKGSVDGLGFAFDPATGAVSGTATAPGYAAIQVQATDATGVQALGNSSFTVLASLAMADAQVRTHVDTVGSATFVVRNEPTAPVSYAVTSGTLPDGFALDATTGTVSGTSHVPVTTSVTVTATDAKGATATGKAVIQALPPLALATAADVRSRVGFDVSAKAPAVTNALGSVAWTLSQGTIPNGTKFEPGDGSIAGKPSAAIDERVAVTATDAIGGANGTATSAPYGITVLPTLAVAGVADLVGHAGVAMRSDPPVVSNSPVAPVTWSTTAKLQQGLNLDGATGVISGTTTDISTIQASLTATDAQGATAVSPSFNVTVGPAIAIGHMADATMRVGNPFSAAAPSVTNDPVLPLSWTLGAQVLPKGLALSPDSGTISGIPTAAAPGSYGLTLGATDATGGYGTSNPFTYTVLAALLATVPQDTVTFKGNPTVLDLPSLGNSPTLPIAWSAVPVDQVPPGMSMDANTGKVSGTPTTTGDFAFAYRASDANGDSATSRVMHLKVQPPMSMAGVTSRTFRSGLESHVEAPVLSYAIGQVAWAISAGSVPGMSLDADSGTMSGTPADAGDYPVTVTATDGDGQVASTSYTVTTLPPLSFTVQSQVYAHQGSPSTIASPTLANQPVAPIRWAVGPTDKLPPGITLDTATGRISGTPTTANNYSFTLTATDSQGATASQGITTIVLGPLSLSRVDDQVMHVDLARSFMAPSVSGNPQPVPAWSFSAGSNPPAGVSVDAATGTQSGTVAIVGDYALGLSYVDGVGGTATTNAYTLHVTPPLSLSAVPDITGRVGLSLFSAEPDVTSTPQSPVQWDAVSGSIPDGMSLSGHGSVGGIPKSAGKSSVTVRVTDAIGGTATSNAFDITVKPALVAGAPTVTNGHVGMAYKSNAPTLSNNPTPPLTWTAAGLPQGLSADPATGVISGTPTSATTKASQATLNVIDATGAKASTPEFDMFVYPPLSMAAVATPVTTHLQSAVSIAAPAITGDPRSPVSWGIAPGGTIPDGLSVDPSTGTISGSPTQAGEFDLALTMTDGTMQVLTSNSFHVTVVPPLLVGQVADATARVGLDARVVAAPDVSGNPVAPLTWKVATGYALPDGMKVDPSVGYVSGAPTAPGKTTAALSVVDATGGGATSNTFTITVSPALTITAGGTYTVHTGTGGDVVSIPAPTLGNSPTLPVTWSTYRNATLPNGLVLNQDGTITSSSTLSNALAGSSATIDVVATDATGATAEQAAAGSATTITFVGPIYVATVADTKASPNVPYSMPAPKVMNSPTAPVTWALTGTLPDGLSFHADTGVVDGTPTATAAGKSYNLTLVATDARGVSTQPSNAFAVTVAPLMVMAAVADFGIHNDKAVTIAPPALSNATSPVTWTVSSTDASLALSGSAGNLANAAGGTTGTYPVTITAKDANGQQASRTYGLTVAGALAASVGPNLQGHVNAAFPAYPVATSNVLTTLSYTVSVTPPAGLSLDAATGQLGGTPTAAVTNQAANLIATEAGPYGETVSIPVKVSTYGAMVATAPASLEVHDTPGLTTGAPSVSGAVGSPTWSAASANPLPTGLSVAPSTGVVSGTTADGTYTLALSALDSTGVAATTGTFTVKVDPVISLATPTNVYSPTLASTAISNSNPLLLRYKVNYSLPFVATNAIGTTTFSGTSVPSGYTVSTTTGTVSGTSTNTTTGTGTMSVAVADNSASKTVQGSGTTTVSVPYSYYGTPLGISAYPTTLSYAVGDSVSVAAPTLTGSPVRKVLTLNATSGSLATGLAFNADGSITGTPTAPDSLTGTVTLSDDTGGTASTTPFTLTVQPVTPASSTYPSGAGYSIATLSADNAHAAYDDSATTYIGNSSINNYYFYLSFDNPVRTDGSLDFAADQNAPVTKLFYNSGTASNPTWTAVSGTVQAKQFEIMGQTSTGGASNIFGVSRFKLGLNNQFPTHVPSLVAGRALPTIGTTSTLDLSQYLSPSVTGTTTWTVTGLPSWATQAAAGSAILNVSPTTWARFSVTVSVTDSTGQASVPVTLTIDPQSTVSAASQYPKSAVSYKNGTQSVAAIYDNSNASNSYDLFTNSSSYTDTYTISFATPVSTDGYVQSVGACSVTYPYANLGTESAPKWVQYKQGQRMTSTQFWFSYTTGSYSSCNAYQFMVGDSAATPKVPAYYPSTTASSITLTLNATATVVLADQQKLVDAQGTVNWTKPSSGIPPGMTFDPTAGNLTGTPTTAGSYSMTLVATDGRGFQSIGQTLSVTVK